MIHVNTNMGKYVFKFSHSYPTPNFEGNKFGTDCELFEENEGRLFYLSKGSTELHEGDNYNKVFGRKLAIKRALNNANIPRVVRNEIYPKLWEKIRYA